MAERQSKKYYTVSSAPVQGDGSYVKFARPQWGEMAAVKRIGDSDERLKAVIRLMVAGWDWVDDDNNPLALPKDDEVVLYQLTNEELQFLVDNCLPGITGQEAKN